MERTSDTIDGLLAEFRGYAAGMPPSYHVTMSWADFRKMLDRFDAAHRREKAEWVNANAGLAKLVDIEKLGDAAKLREALIKAITMLAVCEWPDGTNMEGVEELRRDIDAALDAPPRNCDRFGTDNVEASLAYEEFCDRAEVEESVNGAIAWLLTLVAEKEGGAK